MEGVKHPSCFHWIDLSAKLVYKLPCPSDVIYVICTPLLEIVLPGGLEPYG